MVQSLWSTGLESTYGLYPSLSKLLCLLEIEEASLARTSTPDHTHSLNDLPFIQDWQDRLSHLNSDLQFVEPVLAVRGSVLHHLLQVTLRSDGGVLQVGERRKVESLYKALSKTLLTHSRWAREATNFQVCVCACMRACVMQEGGKPPPEFVNITYREINSEAKSQK